ALPAALIIDVLPTDCMAGVDYPVPQLSQLVLGVLAFVIRRYSRVNRYPHDTPPGRGKKGHQLAAAEPQQNQGSPTWILAGRNRSFYPLSPRRRTIISMLKHCSMRTAQHVVLFGRHF